LKPVVNSGDKPTKPSRDQDQFIDEFCQAWVRWSDTRKFYIPKQASNILGRMQPSKMREPPNARNFPDMQHFNNAVHTLRDMAFSEPMQKETDEEKAEQQDSARHRSQLDFICWMIHYDPDHKILVKVVADKLGIAPRTYYDNIKRFSRKAYSMSQSLKRVYESQQAMKVAA